MNKHLIWFVSILFCIGTTNANNYYIAAGGNDDNNGTSTATPWKTLTKLNSYFSSLKAGDNIYLNRGDVFYGSIVIAASGASGSPITIGAYGSGSSPVVTGFTTVKSWTNLGGNIWESNSSVSSLSRCNMVTVNGVNVAMGRYPNKGYLTYESFMGLTSITSSSLGSINWTGAEAAIRKNDWTIDRCTITNQSGTNLFYTDQNSNDKPTPGYGFFIQNDPRTLDVQNEWYYNPATGKIRVYSNGSPANVRVATVSNLLSNNGFDYITVDGLAFTGASDNAIYFSGRSTDYCNIQNCMLSYCGENGIYFIRGNNTAINNNVITICNRAGIETDIGANNTLSNNTITNIGLVAGQAFEGQHTDGIYASSKNVIIKNNVIKNVSYNGIIISYATGTALVQYNYIDSTNMVLDDGGGIYTMNADASVRTIDHNIVLNSIGGRDGTTKTRTVCAGIYLDDYSSNVVVTNNTVANCSSVGFKLHEINNCTINNNTAYNNGSWQIYYQNNTTKSLAMYNNTMKNNIVVAGANNTSTKQWVLGFHSGSDSDMVNFGIADSNYYARPMNEGNTFDTNLPGTGSVNRSLATWQSFTGQDAHSKTSPKTITDVNRLKFVYNATSSAKTVSLGGVYIDMKNVSYNGSMVLAPYSSAVLIKK